MPTAPVPEEMLLGTHQRRRWLEAGIARRELSGPLWTRLSRGMYAWSADDDITARLHRLGGLAPPGGALGGWAAAHLLGAEDLDGCTAAGRRLPVLLCMPRQQTSRRAPEDVRVWRSDLLPEEIVRIGPTPVTCAARTGFDLARLSPVLAGAGRGTFDETEALVGLEALLRTGKTTVDEIGEYAVAHPRKAGARQVRRILEQAVPNVRSCQETRFRRLWTSVAALPMPLVNATIVDDRGRIVAEVDLLDPDAALVGEYDGAHHANAEQRAKDHARIQLLESLGLGVARVAAPDLSEFRDRTVARLRTLHRAGLDRDRSRDRWRVGLQGAIGTGSATGPGL